MWNLETKLAREVANIRKLSVFNFAYFDLLALFSLLEDRKRCWQDQMKAKKLCSIKQAYSRLSRIKFTFPKKCQNYRAFRKLNLQFLHGGLQTWGSGGNSLTCYQAPLSLFPLDTIININLTVKICWKIWKPHGLLSVGLIAEWSIATDTLQVVRFLCCYDGL